MSKFFYFICLFSFEISAQDVACLMNSLEGQFDWKMWNYDQTTLKRSGERIAHFGVDSLNLLIEESFDDSTIQMNGLIGWNNVDSTFYAVSVFNVDPGPHLMTGRLISDFEIEFLESNSGNIHLLTVVDKNQHHWTSQTKSKSGSYSQNDLKIVFVRKN
ncbi:MAG: hypothetical protein RJQ09_06990 [Cyclobacteriaceae bacterium]